VIGSIEELEALYGTPKPASLVKVADRLTPEYRAWIEAARFCALATVGPEGLDCTPRGDDGQVVFVEDESTLVLPDRLGNNRIDSLRNIIRDPRVSLMFLIPGSDTVIRVNGTAQISADPEVLKAHAKHGKPPRSVIRVSIGEVYFQCARAVMRARLWDGREVPELPKPGQILAALSGGEVGGEVYDREWPARATKNLW
jgi:uncharacterized protein